jgi:DNA topoisomerase I
MPVAIPPHGLCKVSDQPPGIRRVRRGGGFGLASMNDDHAVINGRRTVFRFRGKGGKARAASVDDPRFSRLLKYCRRLPGTALFQYRDDTGRPRRIRVGDLNAWLKEISGKNITAKDLRTWSATVLAFYPASQKGCCPGGG